MKNQTEMEKNYHALWGFLGGVLLGGLIGAVAMLLYAPQSGKMTRAKIQQKSEELNERVTNTVEDALGQTRHKAQQILTSAEQQAKDLQERGQAVLTDQKERFSTLGEAGKTKVEGILK